MGLLKRLLIMARKHWSTLLFASIGIIGSAILNLVTPEMVRRFTGTLETPEGLTLNIIFVFTTVLIASYLLRAVCKFISMAISHLAAWRFVPELTLGVYDKLQQLSLRYFQDKQTGELMSRLVNDTRQLETLIAHALPELISNILVLITVTFMLFSINTKLALITLIPVPFIIILSILFSKKVTPMFKLNQKVLGDLNGVLQDNISGMKEIQAFNQEGNEHYKMIKNCKYYSKVNIRANFANAIFHPIVELFTSFGTVFVIGFGGMLIMQNQMVISDIIGFIMYLSLFYSPLTVLAKLVEDVLISYAGGVRVFEILDAESEIKESVNAEKIENVKGKIEFNNVDFRYNQNEKLLHDISFTANPGEMIALVGPTGVGKTTIVSLMERFYDPQSGTILLDGKDIKNLTLESLRSQISIVLQDIFLFNGTIAENIAYGGRSKIDDDMHTVKEIYDTDGSIISKGIRDTVSNTVLKKNTDDKIISSPDTTISMEKIREAAKIAHADEFIMKMPNGYQTLIGERGVRLSGGQKQRIAIARSVLRDTPILILDEATSAVDTETEAEIQAAIESLAGSRTIIVIAHRLSTVMKSDQILVFEKGMIVERGKHDELINNGGLYSALCRVQWLSDEKRLKNFV